MKAFVYRITHLATGRHYVGKTVSPHKRWVGHKYIAEMGETNPHFSHIHAAIRKYGPSAFEFSIIAVRRSEEAAFREEIRQIAFLKSNERGSGFNIGVGGLGGNVASEEVRQKISKASRGRETSPETRAKISAIRKGHVVTRETRAKIAASLSGRTRGPQTIGWRLNISRANSGRKLSEETKNRMREAWKLRRGKGV